MRGLGEKQAQITTKNRKRILLSIKMSNSNEMYATMNYIHRWTEISKDVIRKHIKILLDEGIIFEETILCNNARGFVIAELNKYKNIKKNGVAWAQMLHNTNDYINSLKFPNEKKAIPKREKLKARDSSLTERQERIEEKKRLKKLRDSKI